MSTSGAQNTAPINTFSLNGTVLASSTVFYDLFVTTTIFSPTLAVVSEDGLFGDYEGFVKPVVNTIEVFK